MAQTRPYSEKTAAEMDEEVRRIIDEAYNRCREILEQNRAALIGTAEYLLEHETMSGEELKKIFDAADSAEE
jgi:cell division protease FtsH